MVLPHQGQEEGDGWIWIVAIVAIVAVVAVVLFMFFRGSKKAEDEYGERYF